MFFFLNTGFKLNSLLPGIPHSNLPPFSPSENFQRLMRNKPDGTGPFLTHKLDRKVRRVEKAVRYETRRVEKRRNAVNVQGEKAARRFYSTQELIFRNCLVKVAMVSITLLVSRSTKIIRIKCEYNRRVQIKKPKKNQKNNHNLKINSSSEKPVSI